MNDQNNLLLNISALYRNVNKYFDRQLIPYAIGTAQMLSLLVIYEHQGLTMQQLSTITELDKGTVTKNIQRLSDAGYIEIVTDESDKRVRHLFTTERTQKIIADLYRIRNTCSNQLIKNVRDEEVDVLDRMSENSRIFSQDEDLSKLRIGGLQKLTLLDYPGKVACTVFAAGCNLKCPFCHNRDLVFVPENFEYYDPDEILAYLDKRRGILEGVCISGGEALLQREMFDFMRRIKEMGYLIKVDTNGQNSEALKEAIDEHLVDYVAMDVKNTWAKYSETVGMNLNEDQLNRYRETMKLLMEGDIDYEFRTTVVKTFHTKEDLMEIAGELKGCRAYYLQSFRSGENLIDQNCEGYSEEEMQDLLAAVQTILPQTYLRG